MAFEILALTAFFKLDSRLLPEKFGLENPIGHRMKFADDENFSTIIGVTEDFHYKGLQSKIAPVAICARMNLAWMGGAAVRFEANEIGNSLATVSDFWQKMEPVFPVTFNFSPISS